MYTSLYLVKFSKFTIKITCGFFCQSSGDNLALCITNTQYALANKCSSLSFSHFPLSFLSFTQLFSLAFFHTQYLSHSIILPFILILCILFFFLLFTLMRGLKSSNKVCLLKNSSYSTFLPRPFFSFFFSIYLSRSISHSQSLVIVMYQNKLNILFTSSLNSVKIFHTFRWRQ